MNEEQNHYCVNLIEVNKKQRVTTSQAIYNDQGVLLLAEGADLNEKRAQILLQHKLMKPLEHCIGIASSFDAKQLFALLNKFANDVPGLLAVTDNDDYQKSLRSACLFYEKFPLLQQNLTVLALRAPTIYFQGIFCALAGLAIALKLDLSIKEQQTTFIAGLFHDIGFLYLAPELREKTQGFSSEEWKALQAHPIIAQRFLNYVPDLPKEIGIAIVDHHERIDGTGYPRHIFGDKLTPASQIIAASDNILVNYHRYKDYGIHTHTLLLIALKLSDNIYFEPVYNATLVLLKYTPEPTTHITQSVSIEKLLTHQKMLQKQFEYVKLLAQQLNINSKNPQVRSVNAVMGRLAIAIIRSGILQPEQITWLETFTHGLTPEQHMSLAEVSVMLDQIFDQLVHLKNLMERIVENIPQTESQFKEEAELTLSHIVLNAMTSI